MHYSATQFDSGGFIYLSVINYVTYFGMVVSLLEKPLSMKKHIEMLDAIFTYASEGILLVNRSGEVIMLNPKAERLFGYKANELIGERVEKLIPTHLRTTHKAHRAGYHENPHARGMGGTLNLFAIRKDHSEFPVEVSLSPFSTGDGDFVVCFVIDITERKIQEKSIEEANREIQKLNAELEARVKLRTRELDAAVKKIEQSQSEVVRALEKERELNDMKSKFVTIASHEFRTPLATILSSASLIGRYIHTEEDEKRQKHVLRIKSAVNNLTEILNDFLSLGKMEEGQIRVVPVLTDLPQFCMGVIEHIKSITKEGQTIIFDFEGPLQVWVDNQLLRNILLNLLSNASKYSDPGKEIILTASLEHDLLTIKITDQGIGIPEQDKEHIFDRFFRAHNAGNVQGTGLGLNIVKKYVDLMGGTIYFENAPGGGTTFTVVLPNAEPEQTTLAD